VVLASNSEVRYLLQDGIIIHESYLAPSPDRQIVQPGMAFFPTVYTSIYIRIRFQL
jgi:hypothetical protein